MLPNKDRSSPIRGAPQQGQYFQDICRASACLTCSGVVSSSQPTTSHLLTPTGGEGARGCGKAIFRVEMCPSVHGVGQNALFLIQGVWGIWVSEQHLLPPVSTTAVVRRPTAHRGTLTWHLPQALSSIRAPPPPRRLDCRLPVVRSVDSSQPHSTPLPLIPLHMELSWEVGAIRQRPCYFLQLLVIPS